MKKQESIDFNAFWSWLGDHVNCIVRAGTPEALLFDDHDLHWQLGEFDGVLLMQLMRGKLTLGELFIDPQRVAFVRAQPPEVEDEHTFELVSESEDGNFVEYVVVVAHGLDDDVQKRRRRVH